ncbi:TPA: hypothetical protein DCX15_03345 [bacterium]|nr:hypothetical protein [bacterium]
MRLVKYAMGFAISIFLLLGIVWQHIELSTMESERIRLKEELRSLKNTGKQLRIEIMELKSPRRIEELAHGIGLVYSQPEERIILPEILLTRENPKEGSSKWSTAKALEKFLSYFSELAQAEESLEEEFR